MLLQNHRPTTPEYSPTQAAALCGVHVDTIRRRLRENAIPGARRDGDAEWAPWLIPVEGLVGCGLLDSASQAIAGTGTLEGQAAAERQSYELTVRHLEATIERLEDLVEFHQSTIRQLLDAAGTTTEKRSH